MKTRILSTVLFLLAFWSFATITPAASRDSGTAVSKPVKVELTAAERTELVKRLNSIDFKKIGKAGQIACKNSSNPVECLDALLGLLDSVVAASAACEEGESPTGCALAIINVISNCWNVFDACSYLWSHTVRMTPSERIRIDQGFAELRKLTKELTQLSAGLAPPVSS